MPNPSEVAKAGPDGKQVQSTACQASSTFLITQAFLQSLSGQPRHKQKEKKRPPLPTRPRASRKGPLTSKPAR
eukprot:scaffold59012_cov12-Tisochrysis_lutea.AAC.1